MKPNRVGGYGLLRERFYRLDLVDEPVALDLCHAQPQLLQVEVALARDLAFGGEVDDRGIPVGRQRRP